MIERLVVLHQSGSTAAPTTEIPSDWIVWKTCLRTIGIGTASPLEDFSAEAAGRDLYRGAAAYRFLLEVACGLHSPLLGETEVMGQFKALLKQTESAAAGEEIAAYEMRAILGAILTDAKAIRREHLANLGSQSYGSLARKYLRDTRAVHLLGAGSLVEDLLPWMKTFPEVSVFSRGSRAAAMLAEKFPQVSFSTFEAGRTHDHSVGEDDAGGFKSALVVAATMSAPAIDRWIAAHPHPFDIVIDLRGEADSDPLALPGVIRLADFFSGVNANLEAVREKTNRALSAIGDLVRAKETARELRPFGWDDLCA